MMKTANIFKSNKKMPTLLLLIIAVTIAICLILFIAISASNAQKPKAEVITISTLERIINVSELSTFSAVYNGIAMVENKKNPEKIDYYVSYESKVTAGVDFEEIEISLDSESKSVIIKIPDVYITDINVDITSLDFIFYNDKVNTSSLSQEAYRACEDDAEHESQKQNAIYELATQNARNILTALTKPIIEQLDSEYELVIE